MEIVVNTRLLLKDKLEGIGWFSYETLKRITREHQEHHFTFAFDRMFDEQFIFADNITPIIIGPQARHPLLFYMWFEHSIPTLLKKTKADLFLSPDGYLSLKTATKSLAVIHDLNFEHYPQDLPFLVRKYYKHFFPRFARKADRIATVSQYSKQDIIKTYGIAQDKIDVVYNGANPIFQALDQEKKKATKAKYSQGADYFVFVGSLHPRKNIARLLKAFDAFRKSMSTDIKLVIVGEKYWWNSNIRKAYDEMEFKNEVIFTGRLYNENLKDVIASALALTYVPYFEGFGIPIIEAMQCETAVITANVTSMPEVSGDAALLVDPFSVDAIKDALLTIAKDKMLRESLIAKGNIRKQDFSWDKTAEALWKSIEKTLNSNTQATNIK